MSDTKISNLTNYTPPIDADVLPIVDTTNLITKKLTWANLKATAKTYFDTLYLGLHAKADTAGIADSATGNAGTATKLAASKTINGVSFDGSANITVPSDIAPSTSGNVMQSDGTVWTSAAFTLINKMGATTYSLSTASGTQNIAHGLGRTPNKIRIIGNVTGSYSSSIFYLSNAEAIGNSDGVNSISWYIDQNGIATDSTTTFKLLGSGYTGYQVAVITFTSTNIVLTWTKTGSPTATANLMWEVE